MGIKAIFFDMGGTIEKIWYTPELRISATPHLQRILRSAEIYLDLSTKEIYEIVTQGWDRYHSMAIQSKVELSSEQVWRDYIFAEIPVNHQKLSAIAQDLMFFLETRYFHREMRTEMPFVLETIKEMGLQIGLISNVNSKDQVPYNLEKYHIRNYFDPIVLSSLYGHRKPNPSIFHFAAFVAKVPASDCIYIGDRIARDIVGSKRAGFRLAIQIKNDFDHGEKDDGVKPDYLIENMTELIDILKTEIINQANITSQFNSRNKMRAFIFDAGDVLYFRPEKNKFFNEFLSIHGKDCFGDLTPELTSLREKAYIGEISQDDYFKALIGSFDIIDETLQREGMAALRKDEANVQFFDGVDEVLIELKSKGYFLGIVTDTANSLPTKLSWFERIGIEHVWDTIISSRDIGVRKPNPKIYLAALDQLGIKAGEAVFVSHKTSELSGAKALGMETIAFNYDLGAPADHYVKNFSDILNIPVGKLPVKS